jgi:hypothetical protein
VFFCGRPGITYFRGLDGPGGPQNPYWDVLVEERRSSPPPRLLLIPGSLPPPRFPRWGAAAPPNLPRGMWGAAAPQPQSQRGASPQLRPPQGATYRRNHRAKLCPKLAVPPRWAYRKAKGATSRPRITNLEIPGNVLPSWRAVNRGSRGLVLWWFRVILGIDHSRGHSVFV